MSRHFCSSKLILTSCQHAKVDAGTIRTANASILGNITATQSLTLVTQNGAIVADVVLLDEGGRGSDGGPSLTMNTANA